MEIRNFTVAITDSGSTLAEFDVYIEKQKLTLFNFRVIRTKKGKTFAVRPSYGRDYNGTKKYYPYMQFEGELDKEFDRQLQKAVEPYLKIYARELRLE